MLSSSERVVGVLLGTALGDAFGAPFEGAVAGAIDRQIVWRATQPRVWRYTDDTEMTLAVARALAAGRDLEPSVLLAELARSYDVSRGYGHGMRRCLEAFQRGMPWSECAFTSWSEGSAGNGAAARVAPVACRYARDPARVVQAAALSSRVSHAHPDAVRGAVFQAAAVSVCMGMEADAFSANDFLERLSRHDIDAPLLAKVAEIRAVLRAEATPRIAAGALGTSTLAVHSVPAAIWAFASVGPSFEGAITAAAQLGGDVDSICAMTGALVGALCGPAVLPQRWLENLRHERPGVAEIEAIGRALLVPG